MSDVVRAVLAGGEPELAAGLAAALGAPTSSLPVDAFDDAVARYAGRLDPAGLVWLHLVPSLPADVDDPFAEAALLLRSASVARATAAHDGVPVVCVPIVPNPGLYTGGRGLACDLALTASLSLMRTDIATWSSEGRRLVGVAYAGLEGRTSTGLRDADAVRLRTPIGVPATYAQLAGAVRFVASARAAYMTGTLLSVDGGCAAYSWMYPARTI